jgi:hypothetical protein
MDPDAFTDMASFGFVLSSAHHCQFISMELCRAEFFCGSIFFFFHFSVLVRNVKQRGSLG